MSSSWPQWWQKFYGLQPPVGHILRETFSERWFRIHSLPESKRYAENEEEYALLLTRHNTIATQVLGEGAECTLFIPRYDDSPCVFAFNDITPQYCGIFEEPSVMVDGIPDNIHIWHAPVIWRKECFNELIRAVACWREPSMLFVCHHTGRAYQPYDGGADLFLESSMQMDILKRRHREWLSVYASGM